MQGFEKWLYAALNEAAEAVIVDGHVTYAGRQRDLSSWRRADERDLDSVDLSLFGHTG